MIVTPLLVASSIPLLYCGGGNLSSDPWTISRVSQGTFKHFHCDTFCVFLVDYVWSGFLEMFIQTFTQHMDGTSAAPASLLVVQLSATQTAGESLKPKTQAIAEWYLAYYKLYYVLCQLRKVPVPILGNFRVLCQAHWGCLLLFSAHCSMTHNPICKIVEEVP